MNLRLGMVGQCVAFLLALALVVNGLAREAQADGGSCDRTVTRTWMFPPGAYQYSDSGCAGLCPPTEPPLDVCDDHYIITVGATDHYCYCASNPSAACVKVVNKVHGESGGFWSTAPSCLDLDCTGSCDPLWTPPHGYPQTLTCPCI